MHRYIPFKLRPVRNSIFISVVLFSTILSQHLWAAQNAVVTTVKAIIYADEQMSAAVGFVSKGKKVKVGNKARNRAQVYPIIVSGKIAYIRVIDVSTERESEDSRVLVAERFLKSTQVEQKYIYSATLFNFSSQINLDKENDALKDKDSVNWYGVGIRGGSQISPRWDFDVLFNYMTAKVEQEVFRAVEIGIGGSFRIFEKGQFKLRSFVQLLGVPYSSYALGDEFRVNGYGFSTGAGLNSSYRMGQHWGAELFAGFYYTKLTGLKSSAPYNPIAPSFIGSRLGLGVNYQF